MSNGNTFFLHGRRPDPPSPRAAQDRGRGRRLIVVGWVLRVGGAVLGVGSILMFQIVLRGIIAPSDPVLKLLSLLGCVLALFAGWAALGLAHVRQRGGRQHTAEIIDSGTAAARSGHVLYLRPFDLDEVMSAMPYDLSGGGAGAHNILHFSGRTQEEDLVERFRRCGPVIAIGRPGDELPKAGAQRMYVADSEWQQTVSGLIDRARVVALSVGPGQGTMWEFVQCLRTLPPERLVLLIYCERKAYDDFRRASADLCALPDFPPFARPHRPRWEVLMNSGRKRLLWDFTLKGLIVFGPDWQPRFVRFDPTPLRIPTVRSVRKLLKRGFEPVLDRLEKLPPRR
ncbi:hypothetical protein [Streptomyces sp. NPDC046909]|uniref:hypothetical protein n=1 Tax=Streptomyces sp. NPDC046909 TaxID=3155617 RepID=UPI0033CCFF01